MLSSAASVPAVPAAVEAFAAAFQAAGDAVAATVKTLFSAFVMAFDTRGRDHARPEPWPVAAACLDALAVALHAACGTLAEMAGKGIAGAVNNHRMSSFRTS